MRTIPLLRRKHGLKGVKRGFDWHTDWHSTVSIKSIKDVSCLFVETCADRITAKRRGRETHHPLFASPYTT
jgi:hypothetical protein